MTREILELSWGILEMGFTGMGGLAFCFTEITTGFMRHFGN